MPTAGRRSDAMRTVMCLFLLCCLHALLPPPADACSCADPGPTVLLERAHFVFTGEAVQAEIVDGGGVMVEGKTGKAVAPAAIVTFRVHGAWKGSVPSQMRVWTLVGPPGMCGVDFRLGEKYLVFSVADSSTARWQAKTDLCFGTGHVRSRSTQRRLRALGPPRNAFPVPTWWGDLLEVE
jgi:hypothetical protein